MGLIDFFKKIGKQKEIKPTGKVKLELSEVDKWLDKKNKELEKEEEELREELKNKIERYNSELKEKIIALENFDISEKKDKENIKEIVKEGRREYIQMVQKLMGELANLEEKKYSDYTKKVDKLFLDFNKSSFKNYERATILIGKEMANIKNTFKNFSKELLEMFKNKTHIPEFFQIKERINLEISQLESVKEEKKRINNNFESIKKNIAKNNQNKKEILDKIKEIKNSEDNKKNLENKEKIKLLEKEIEKSVFELRQLIDFKSMTNFFHIFPDKMNYIKNYRDKFSLNFEKDLGKGILELLDESKLNNNKISDKIALIKLKIKKLDAHKNNLKEDETKTLILRIDEIEKRIENLESEKKKFEKRIATLNTNEKDLLDSLKSKLRNVGVELL